jgi:hypothetical protein
VSNMASHKSRIQGQRQRQRLRRARGCDSRPTLSGSEFVRPEPSVFGKLPPARLCGFARRVSPTASRAFDSGGHFQSGRGQPTGAAVGKRSQYLSWLVGERSESCRLHRSVTCFARMDMLKRDKYGNGCPQNQISCVCSPASCSCTALSVEVSGRTIPQRCVPAEWPSIPRCIRNH